MKIVFLGTSSMQPTKERGLPAFLFSHGSENILVDCGEGTQRQMKIKKIKPNKLTKILISHWHGDHVLGLGGLIRNLGANQYGGILEIYGPKDIEKYMGNILNSCVYEERIKIKLIEIKHGKIFENKDFFIEAFKLKHPGLCYGFNFIEKERRKINLNYTKKFGLVKHQLLGDLQKGKDIIWKGKRIKVKDATNLVFGKKVSYISDTKYFKDILNFIKNADLLISEATYLEIDKDKAEAYQHLTAKQAAKLAKEGNVKKLVLTHFSQRYKDEMEFKEEAVKIYRNVVCAKDFMEINI